MDEPATRKELSHRRIVEAAARAIRRDGFAGVGVADVMRDAGLTHGGFYAHFASRDDLLVAALDAAGSASAGAIARSRERRESDGATPFRALVEGYLADGLLKSPEAGCPVAALCGEMPRQSLAVRKASVARVRSLVRYVRKTIGDAAENDDADDDAGVVAATLVGALQLARSLGGSEGRSLLAATRRSLLDRYDR